MRWPWTEWKEWMEARIGEAKGLTDENAARLTALESRVAELSRRAPSDDPTGEGLPEVVRAAIDEAVAPWDEDRVAIKARGRMIRGARARLRAGITDAAVAEWVRTGEEQ